MDDFELNYFYALERAVANAFLEDVVLILEYLEKNRRSLDDSRLTKSLNGALHAACSPKKYNDGLFKKTSKLPGKSNDHINRKYIWMIGKLLQAGADPNSLDHKGRTALMVAVEYGTPEIIEKLYAIAPNLQRELQGIKESNTSQLPHDLVDELGIPALITDPNLVDELGIPALITDPNIVNELGETALRKVVELNLSPSVYRNEHIDGFISSILKSPLIDVDIPDNKGITPLMIASQKLKVDIVKKLLERGADPNLKVEKGYYEEKTALDFAKGAYTYDAKTERRQKYIVDILEHYMSKIDLKKRSLLSVKKNILGELRQVVKVMNEARKKSRKMSREEEGPAPGVGEEQLGYDEYLFF